MASVHRILWVSLSLSGRREDKNNTDSKGISKYKRVQRLMDSGGFFRFNI
jgi:hypothetical protein